MDGNTERRAAIVLILLALAGLFARFVLAADGAPGAVLYRPAETSRPSRDSVTARAIRLGRPLKRGERIDIDRASVEEMARLPRVGPGLAARIVAHRERHGPFGSLDALDRIPGVGEALVDAIRPHVTFSAHGGELNGGGPADGRTGGRMVRPDWQAAVRSGDAGRDRREVANGRPGGRRINLNSASVAELASLPGIGPTRAQAIIADRKTNGPYRALDDLARVRGIGPATLDRLKDRVSVP